MAVNLEELQTFVNNFIDLTNKGIDVNLSLNYYSGQVTVNLQTTFKKVQLPPNSSTLSESHLSTSSKPSRKRRRKRRQLARDLYVSAKNEPVENEKKQYMDSFRKPTMNLISHLVLNHHHQIVSIHPKGINRFSFLPCINLMLLV